MIKKLSFFAVLFSLAYSLSASHLLGGEITWECQGSNSYIFTLKLYRDCGGVNLTGTSSIDGPEGVISLSRDSIRTVNQACHSSSLSYTCPGGTGGVEAHIYKSGTITFNGAPPPTGWSFEYTDCCRTPHIVNTPNHKSFGIESVMYPDPSGQCNDSPVFAGDARPIMLPGEFSTSMMAIKPLEGDSLYYKFVPARDNNGASISFNPGYSASAPFPDSTENVQNGPVSLDPTTGLIGTSVASDGSLPTFQYALQVECWRNNQLVSVVTRDMVMILSTNQAAAATNPDVAIDTTGLRPVGGHPILSGGNKMKIAAFPGDTVRFNLQATDIDQISGSTFEKITFSATGYSLAPNWPGGGTSPYGSLPVITPQAPQANFSSRGINNIEFMWVIGNEHIHGTKSRHLFNLSFRDEGCPSVRVANTTLEVVTAHPAFAVMDTLKICEGDSVQLTGSTTIGNNFRWSPAVEISDTTAAEPWISATTSRYYYLSDPDNPGFIDSVYVQVEARAAFDLAYNNGLLTLTYSVDSGTRLWFYNNIPFSYPHDTLTPFGSGLYKAVSTTDFCKYFTNEIHVAHSAWSLSDTTTGELSDDLLVLTDSMGIVFRIDSSGAGDLSQIIIPGMVDLSGKSGGNALHLSIQDDQHQVVWSLDTLAEDIDNGLFKTNLELQLTGGQEYTLRIQGDTGFAFHYLENVQLPFRPWNGPLVVSGLFEDTAATAPPATSDRMIPVVLKVEQNIGLEEQAALDVRIYPNPAGDRFVVEGAQLGSQLQLTTLEGKIVKQQKATSETSVIERGGLPAGIYLLHFTDGNQQGVQKVIFR